MEARWLPDKHAAAAALSTGTGNGTIYYLHQRKAGGDIWKGGRCGDGGRRDPLKCDVSMSSGGILLNK